MSNISIQSDVDSQGRLRDVKAVKVTRNWQELLRPVMTRILVGLTIFFFVATFLQLSYLHWNILQTPPVKIPTSAGAIPPEINITFDEAVTARQLEILTALEAYLVERRYYQASVLLMSGLWVRYLGFVTGMILALVGASYILGKLQEPASEITGAWSALDFSVKSTSPGLILATLGVLLMFTTIISRQEYSTTDSPVYLLDSKIEPTATVTPIPILQPLEEFDTPGPLTTEQPASDSN